MVFFFCLYSLHVPLLRNLNKIILVYSYPSTGSGNYFSGSDCPSLFGTRPCMGYAYINDMGLLNQ